MPTLNAYENESGHYIVGRISKQEWSTYQVDPVASEILLAVGYSDEDELPWSVVDALRAVGIVGIGDEEDQRDESDFDEKNLESEGGLEKLSTNAAKKLLAEIKSLNGVSEEGIERAKIALDIDDGEGGSDINASLEFALKAEQFQSTAEEIHTEQTEANPEKHTSVFFIPDDHDDSISVSLERGDDHKYIVRSKCVVQASLIDSIRGDQTGMLLFNVYINHDGSNFTGKIESVEVTVEPWQQSDVRRPDGRVSLRNVGIAYKAVDDLLPIVKEALEAEGVLPNVAIGDVEVDVVPI